eukprot:PITA_24327
MIGIVLTGKENYPDWSRMVQHTLIFNELWKGVCVGEGDSDPEKPTSDKELAIWENKNSKAYALIAASVNKEVSRHISTCSTAFEALQKLKELYDSHSALEVVQLMIKLFTLELQNNDPLALASEIKSIVHDIKSTKVELDISLIAFLKALYPTYSNYPESLQANGNLKDITFDSLVKKFVKEKKPLERRQSLNLQKRLYAWLIKKNILLKILQEEEVDEEEEEDTSEAGGEDILKEKRQIYIVFAAKEMDHMMPLHANYHGTKLSREETNRKVKMMIQTKLLDSGATCHMTHRKDFFEDFTDNVDGVVYFADQSKIKPSGLGTIRLKLPSLPDFLLDHVLYLPQLKRNLLSLVHIRQQGHSIHMFDGKLEVRKSSDHSLVMRGIEEERLLKLQGTSAHKQHFSYITHHEEGTLPSSLLWHARFGHLNYDSLCLLKKNDVAGLPTIPRKLKQCDACILGKHSKQSFHDSHSRAHRKLERIHSDLCGPMPVPSANGNKYIMTFIDDYTRMCWVYLLKNKLMLFKHSRIFINGLKMMHNLILGLFALIMEKNIHKNEFEQYLRQHGIKHQTIVPYNPQQNGVAERMNRTILNMVRSMLFFKKCKDNVLG